MSSIMNTVLKADSVRGFQDTPQKIVLFPIGQS